MADENTTAEEAKPKTERFASPQVVHATAAGSAVLSHAMYAATGPVGLAVTAGVGAGSAAGVWGLRKFAPALAERWGLSKPAKQAGKALGKLTGGRVMRSLGGRGGGLLGRRGGGRGSGLLGRRRAAGGGRGGLLGNLKRRTGAGSPKARRVAGHGPGRGKGAGKQQGRSRGLLGARNARKAAQNTGLGTRTTRRGTGTGRTMSRGRKTGTGRKTGAGRSTGGRKTGAGNRRGR